VACASILGRGRESLRARSYLSCKIVQGKKCFVKPTTEKRARRKPLHVHREEVRSSYTSEIKKKKPQKIEKHPFWRTGKGEPPVKVPSACTKGDVRSPPEDPCRARAVVSCPGEKKRPAWGGGNRIMNEKGRQSFVILRARITESKALKARGKTAKARKEKDIGENR